MQPFSADLQYFYLFSVHENLIKTFSKVAHNQPQFFLFSNANQPESSPHLNSWFIKNLPPRDFSIMPLVGTDLIRYATKTIEMRGRAHFEFEISPFSSFKSWNFGGKPNCNMKYVCNLCNSIEQKTLVRIHLFFSPLVCLIRHWMVC